MAPDELNPENANTDGTAKARKAARKAAPPTGGPTPGPGPGPDGAAVGTPPGDAFTAWLSSWPAGSVAKVCKIDPATSRLVGRAEIERRRVEEFAAHHIDQEGACLDYLVNRWGPACYRWSAMLPDGTTPPAGTYRMDGSAATPVVDGGQNRPPSIAQNPALELKRLELEAEERRWERQQQAKREEAEAEQRRADREEARKREEAERRRAEQREDERMKRVAEERQAEREERAAERKAREQQQADLMRMLLEQRPAAPVAPAPAPDPMAALESMLKIQERLDGLRKPAAEGEGMVATIRDIGLPLVAAVATRLRQPPAAPAPASAPTAPPVQQQAPTTTAPAPRTTRTTAPPAPPALRRGIRRALLSMDTLQAVQSGEVADTPEAMESWIRELPDEVAQLIEQRDQPGLVGLLKPVVETHAPELVAWLSDTAVQLWLSDYLTRAADLMQQWDADAAAAAAAEET